MTAIDPARPEVIVLDVPDQTLLTLDALADAAERLPEVHAQHHLAQLGRLLPDGRVERLPLATAEVATVCELSHEEAREALGRVATERHVGADGFWTLEA